MTTPATAKTSGAEIPRRTRAQRREATRIALLDATIQSLIRNGYAATTTRGVAELAGVSQGAQQHHYPSKSDLVQAATIHLAEVFAGTLRAEPPGKESPRDRAARFVDLLWIAANQPLTEALLEYVGAARTDPAISASVVELITHIDTLAYSLLREVAPEVADADGAQDWLRVTVSSMCAAVAVTSLPGAAAVAPTWDHLRDNVLAGLDRLLGE